MKFGPFDCFLDIETRKMEVEPPYQNPDRPGSQLITKRWQVIAVGVAMRSGMPEVIWDEYSEEDILNRTGKYLESLSAKRIFYGATRQFDEMILKGRFINARREFLNKPGPWPYMLDAEDFEWINLGPIAPNPDGRSAEVPSMPITEMLRHCKEDVVNLRRAARSLAQNPS